MKRRTIIAGSLMIGLVVMMLGVGSWAVFNDTEEAGRYTAAAGTIDLELGESTVVWTPIGDLKPSEWHYLGPFWLHNAGENPGRLDLHFMDVDDSEGDNMSEPECEAEDGTWDADIGTCTDPLGIYDISNWIDVDYWIDGPHTEPNPGLVCPTEPGTILGKLGDIESRAWDLEFGEDPYLEMQKSQWYVVCLSFHLETDAGNEYQGDETAFDIVFTLHQVDQPADRETIRLENKTGDPLWAPILNDDLYGSVTYRVKGNGDLEMLVRLNGLTPNKWHQLVLNGSGGCGTTDDQLASGSEQFTNFDSGFWDGGPALNQVSCAGMPGEGIYNFAYRKTDANGDWIGTIVVTNSGEADPAEAGKVLAANPALPVGVYSNVKFIVKEVVPAWDGPPNPLPWFNDPADYNPVLMEMLETLDFNLP